MTVEQMCCTREQSKRLRELGIDQKSYFYHTIVHVTHLPYVPIGETWDRDLIGSAWTAGELGVMLPDYYESHFDGIHWNCGLQGETRIYSLGMTQAEAMANELIGSLIAGDISIKKVNQRLHE